MDGKSKIQLDKDTINILLTEFANKDDTKIRYENGHFIVDKAGMILTLTELPLKNTKLEVKAKSRVIDIVLSDFKLEDSQLSLDIDLGLR